MKYELNPLQYLLNRILSIERSGQTMAGQLSGSEAQEYTQNTTSLQRLSGHVANGHFSSANVKTKSLLY